MHDQIGQLAGKIWHRLGEKGAVPVASLPKVVGAAPDIVSMALGWLARESKVEFTTTVSRSKNALCVVDLTADERKVFEAVSAAAPAQASS